MNAGREGLACNLFSNSSIIDQDSVQSSSPMTNSNCLYAHCVVHWCAVMLEQDGVILKLFQQSWEA